MSLQDKVSGCKKELLELYAQIDKEVDGLIVLISFEQLKRIALKSLELIECIQTPDDYYFKMTHQRSVDELKSALDMAKQYAQSLNTESEEEIILIEMNVKIHTVLSSYIKLLQ